MYPEDFESELSGIALVLYLIYMLVMLAVSVGSYVLYSMGVYSIAKRRGIHKPWLAWIPVGNLWILGSISDQYQYVVKGKVKNKRKTLLILDILMVVGSVAMVVLYAVAIVGMIAGGKGGEEFEYLQGAAIGALLGILLAALALAAMSVAAAVIQYMALYDLFSSCEPNNNVLYLVLSIFVSIALPIIVFVCRSKDLGMPPRKAEPSFIAPAPEEEPWQNPDPQPEPWENNPEE